MEQAPCPISGNSNSNSAPLPFLTVTDRFDPEGVAQWRLVRDPESELIYLSFRPDEKEMAAHYPESCYDPLLSLKGKKTLRDRLYLALRQCVTDRKASLIEKSGPPLSLHSRLLEIGCSTGELLGRLRRRNHIPAEHCLGFEKDNRPASYARKTFGVTVQTGDFCDSPPAGVFSRIIFWHSLEHLHRINETLHTASQLLSKKGVMVIALPNAGSFDAIRYGKDWVAWDAPRHFYHFTPASLGKLLKQHDLEITSMQPFIPDTFYNCLNSEQNSRSKNRPELIRQVRGLIRGTESVLAGIRNKTLSSTLVYTVRTIQ